MAAATPSHFSVWWVKRRALGAAVYTRVSVRPYESRVWVKASWAVPSSPTFARRSPICLETCATANLPPGRRTAANPGR